MAVMSFLHMKNKKVTDTLTRSTVLPSVASRDDRKQTGGVMSFAHLKKQKPVGPHRTELPAEPRRIELPTEPQRTSFRIPAVLPTALLASVNYCSGCERFMTATTTEKENGNHYGRCLREKDHDSGLESWRKIPTNAKVSRCFFNIR